MPRTELTRAALLLLLWLASAAVQAHGLDVIAQHSEGQVSGLALYSDGTPAAAIYVALVASEDASRVLAQSKTGEDGRFTFAAREDGGMRVIAEGEEGHRAQALVSEVPAVIKACCCCVRISLAWSSICGGETCWAASAIWSACSASGRCGAAVNLVERTDAYRRRGAQSAGAGQLRGVVGGRYRTGCAPSG